LAFKRKKFLGCLRCSNIRAYGVRYSGEGERLACWASGHREGGRGRRFARCFAGESALAREESRLPPTAPGEIAGGGEVRPGGGKRERIAAAAPAIAATAAPTGDSRRAPLD